jgi:UDP-N-acetylmuramoyl-tripeptide--D-alanyl-D-alanine ligase
MTMLWTQDALRAGTGGAFRRAFDASGVSIDTRTLRPGDLFVALQGETDGHAFVVDALARGAAGAMVHRTDGLPDDAPLLVVGDTLDGLHALGREGRAHFGGKMLAVTGSVGKTTTKEMLRTALSAFGPTHAAEASYNNHWGVPLTLARLPPGAAFCVAEIGMNHAGEIAPLARLAAPHVAIVTEVASAHIGHLGSLEAIADEKASVLEGLAPDGFAILPGDSPFLSRMAEAAPGRVITFGQAEGADARLLRTNPVQARICGQTVEFPLAAPGAHMALNAVAALAACAALGLDVSVAAAALSSFAPGAGRGLQRTIRGGDILLLDESYNASSASVRAALGVLAALPGRRVAVLGDMLELGAFGPAEHAGLAKDVASNADLLYACGPLMRHLYDSVPDRRRGAHAPDSTALAPLVAAAVRPGDAVLVKGSLGSRMRLVVAALEHAGAPG